MSAVTSRLRPIVLASSGLHLALLLAPLAAAQAPRHTRADDFAPIPGTRWLTQRLVVRPLQRREGLAAGPSAREVAARSRAARDVLRQLRVLRHVVQTDESVVEVPAGIEPRTAAEALLATGLFEYAEPDWLLAPLGAVPQDGAVSIAGPRGALRPPVACPDDPLLGLQYQHDLLGSCNAWRIHTGTPAISVGVCDTGIRVTHEELRLHRLEGYNAVDMLWESEGGHIDPVFYHGTRVTGCIAATGDNDLGGSGIGWNLSHRMVRVSNMANGNAFLSDLQHGARTSIEAGDRIANVSYAGVSSASNRTTATYIRSLGGLLFWGAGNSGGSLGSPDRDADDLLVIGASTSTDTRWIDSNHGLFVDLFAPGHLITTTDSGSDSDYATASGTSYASPIAAGVAAMIWSARPGLSPDDVEAILKASCDDIGDPGVDPVFGYGRVSLLGALTEDGSTVPVASFDGYPTEVYSPMGVHFQDRSTGVPTSWSWDFGDGTGSTEASPMHVYAAPGVYTVSLTVGNALGSDSHTITDFVTVDLLPPVAAFAAAPTGGLAPVTVAFVDQTLSGQPLTWSWDFGDGGTSTLQDPVHTYTTSGIYTVTLQATNAFGTDTVVKSDLVAVDFIPPVADFGGTPVSGNSPHVVDFTDLSTGGAVSTWSWNFGDGRLSSAANPSHTYVAAGTYGVSLTVSNPWGSDTLVRTGYVTVGPGPEIVPDFVGTPTSGAAPLTVSFTDLTIGYPVSWAWDFGDGGSSSEQHPTHTYTVPGQYNVNLEVTTAGETSVSIELSDYVDVQ